MQWIQVLRATVQTCNTLRKSLAYHSISERSYNYTTIISSNKQWYYKDLLNYILSMWGEYSYPKKCDIILLLWFLRPGKKQCRQPPCSVTDEWFSEQSAPKDVSRCKKRIQILELPLLVLSLTTASPCLRLLIITSTIPFMYCCIKKKKLLHCLSEHVSVIVDTTLEKNPAFLWQGEERFLLLNLVSGLATA